MRGFTGTLPRFEQFSEIETLVQISDYCGRVLNDTIPFSRKRTVHEALLFQEGFFAAPAQGYACPVLCPSLKADAGRFLEYIFVTSSRIVTRKPPDWGLEISANLRTRWLFSLPRGTIQHIFTLLWIPSFSATFSL